MLRKCDESRDGVSGSLSFVSALFLAAVLAAGAPFVSLAAEDVSGVPIGDDSQIIRTLPDQVDQENLIIGPGLYIIYDNEIPIGSLPQP